MSKKDLAKAEKAAAKAAKASAKLDAETTAAAVEASKPQKKKDPNAAARKALAMMERDEAKAAAKEGGDGGGDGEDDFGIPKKKVKLSKKEEKMAKKKAEKDAAKAAKKAAKMAKKDEEDGGDGEDDVVDGDGAVPDPLGDDEVSEETTPPPPTKKQKVTLEERIRKERPPPRIRVLESSQPNFSSLRLENVGVTFRDQEVVKDVTWGVQTGDRIGLVGHNGAGKTTQLRILAGELEPTTGDVVKSSKSLRVAMLRQEFVDELVLDRTLKEEFMSVFVEELEILDDLRKAEVELEQVGGDTERMQEVLDKMQELQNRAESKGVYALESRAKKVMNLMGFDDEEEDYLVAMFSGGWKMRIGLGKVLLKEPNILMLDEPTNHLDLESVEWLEAFLIEQNIPMITVSHDREFLDRVCNKIVDAEGGICTAYDGNYSRFLELKKCKLKIRLILAVNSSRYKCV